jgi:hypothetical protein
MNETNNIQAAARAYADAGYKLVRLKSLEKVPYSKAWQNAEPKPEHFAPDDNIGVQLGSKSDGLVDLDLDIPQARALSGLPCFFGHLPSFRRASQPADMPGHRLVICRDAPDKRESFDFRGTKEQSAIEPLKLAKGVVLELRVGGCQTAFPPSRLGDDELICDGDLVCVPEMSWVDLRARAGLLAFSAFAAANYPSEGNRDNFCFHLTGAYVHAGVDPAIVDQIVEAIARLNGDDEADKRAGKAAVARERKTSGDPIVGLPAFLEFIGMQECEKRLRSWLNLQEIATVAKSPSSAPTSGSIYVGNPNIAERTEQIESALIENGLEVFRRGEELVHVMKLEADEVVDGVRRPKNFMAFRRATPDWLAYQASRMLEFFKVANDRHVIVAPSAELMKPLQATIDERKFPSVERLVTTPTLTRDEPGYDHASKLFLAFEEGQFGSIPTNPAMADAEAALARLMHPAREFPFATPVSKSVWLAAMLTSVVRGQLRTCPLIAFDAPAAGSGKTRLAEMVGILALGVRPPAASWVENEEENGKALFSILRAGDQVVLFDNVMAEISHPDLCKALTSPTIQGRILGVSETVTLGTRTLFLVTGNNLQIASDMTRRTVTCRIDAAVENPEERQFDFDPVQEVLDNRASLVADALIVLRAYVTAGRPITLPAFNSFEDWDLIRGALVWLGQPDPKESLDTLRENDPKREEKAALFIALLSAFGTDRPFLTRDIDSDRYEMLGLRSAITRLLPRPIFSVKSAGKLLGRHRNQPFKGVRLVSHKIDIGLTNWSFTGTPDEALRRACNLDEMGRPDAAPPF